MRRKLVEDNNKKDLNENNENKGRDLSEQLDKLFSSLNLSRKKEEPVKTQEEPEQTSLESDTSVEQMFWGDTKAKSTDSLESAEFIDSSLSETESFQEQSIESESIVPETVVPKIENYENQEAESIEIENVEKVEADPFEFNNVEIESIEEQNSEEQNIEFENTDAQSVETENPVSEQTETALNEAEIFTVNEDITSTQSLEDELNALFSQQENTEVSTSLPQFNEVNMDINDEKEDIDIDGIINSLDDISLETNSVSIDEFANADFNLVNDAEFLASELQDIEAMLEQNSNNEYNSEEQADYPEVDEFSQEKSSIHNIIDDELKKQIDDLKETGYQGQGFVYEEGVNSETIPLVEDQIEIAENGAIDYDKVVGENHLMNIESIYDCKDLIKQMSETVFMIELYGRTLPENLPIDVKRESVLSIIRASSIQVDELLSDAYQRIDVLNEVLEDVAQKAEELDSQNKSEIQMLEEKIRDLKNRIEKRSQYRQSQNAMIGYEIQRIVNIVEFIEPE